MYRDKYALHKNLRRIRKNLDRGFSSRTAYLKKGKSNSSSGHCAAVAAIIHEILGGRLVSATVNGESHWFNRLEVDGDVLDLDLTGDQFGKEPIQVAKAGDLYSGTKERFSSQLDSETLERAWLLANKAYLDEAARKLKAALR
jgi:hypothetical protein